MIIDRSTSYNERTGLWWLVYKESDGMYCLICKRHCHFKAEIYCTKLDHVRSKNHKAAELEELVQNISPFEKDLQEKKQYADEVYDAAFKSMYWIAKEAGNTFRQTLCKLTTIIQFVHCSWYLDQLSFRV
jgi:hypothetical protein